MNGLAGVDRRVSCTSGAFKSFFSPSFLLVVAHIQQYQGESTRGKQMYRL